MIAPAYFLGIQHGIPGVVPDAELWNLTEDIPHHTKGSTVARETLQRAGYELPERRPE